MVLNKILDADDLNILLDFPQFLKEFNIVGLGIGTLVANNTLEIGKAFTDSVLMPIVNGILTQTVPDISYYALVQTLLTFVVTMFVIFAMLRLFNIRMTKPVTYVRVINDATDKDAKFL